VKQLAGFSLPASSRRYISMFQIFMGKPSTSEGLSLKEAVSTNSFALVNCMELSYVHVFLLRDELHGALDL
jgi:hypothetical protein